MPASILIQRPHGATDRLVLLFHGVGSSAQAMAPLAELLARRFPSAFVVSLDAAHPSDLGTGRQWFSVRGITEETRPVRINAAMPEFLSAIHHWQGIAHLGADATTLIGFSQGAIMSLESTQIDAAPARRIVAIAGRFALPPRLAPTLVRLHLLHGQQDGVIPFVHTVTGAERWTALGGAVTVDLFPQAGHEIDGEIAANVLDRLDSDS